MVMEILPGRKMRFESADQTTIFNSDVRRSLCLSHTSKKAYPSDESDWPAGRQLGSSIPGSSFDEAKEGLLKRLTWGTVGEQVTQEELGEQFVEGKRASGFRIDRTSIVNQEVRAHEVWTVWADAETGLLLRMDCVTDWPRGRMEETWSDFRFNNDFDDALFSVEPPAGYEVVTLEMLCLDPEYAKGVCDSNLLQIGMAITAYMHNHDLQYPDSLEELKPILQWPKAFICPGPGSGEQGYIYDKPVTPFPRDLNFATLRSVMIVYDKPGNHEGGRNVLFLDGHVQWLSEEEFKKQWAEQHVHPAAEHAPPAQEGQTP
jgi:prepilin-type processing-associated H-X9-DG protein